MTTLSIQKLLQGARFALNIVGALPIIAGFAAWFVGVVFMGNREQVATIILPLLGAGAIVAISSLITLHWQRHLHLGFGLIFFALLTTVMFVNIVSELLHKGYYSGWDYPLMLLFMIIGFAGLVTEVASRSMKRVS